MHTRPFGRLGAVSALTLGGGGLGQLWGKTSRDECVATTREAAASGITLFDLAPTYGDGEAERVIGAAFEGALPAGLRVTTKCRLGTVPAGEVYATLERSLTDSLARMRLQRVDLFLLHNMVVDDSPDEPPAMAGTSRTLLLDVVVPAFERLVASGRVGAWGLTGIGTPGVLIDLLTSGAVRPAAVQVITNLLDSPGGLKRFDGPSRAREILAACGHKGAAVMGIRAVQAGALTSALDRPLPPEHPEQQDYRRAEPFRALAGELGESPASLAHRYALSMHGVATVVLGVKNREELRECIAAEAAGPLPADVMARIDRTVAG